MIPCGGASRVTPSFRDKRKYGLHDVRYDSDSYQIQQRGEMTQKRTHALQ